MVSDLGLLELGMTIAGVVFITSACWCWALWYLVSHLARTTQQAMEQQGLALQHLWSSETGRDPHRAAAAASLETAARMASIPFDQGAFSAEGRYPHDDAMARAAM